MCVYVRACVVSRGFQSVADSVLVSRDLFAHSRRELPTRVLRLVPLSALAIPLAPFRHRRRFRATPARERGRAYLVCTRARETKLAAKREG